MAVMVFTEAVEIVGTFRGVRNCESGIGANDGCGDVELPNQQQRGWLALT